jgi:hypothetical protein
MKRIAFVLAGPAMFIVAAPALASESDLKAPVRLQANGADITVDIGHAAPYLHDWDRDGVRDLLVGQFGEGKLRIYRNHGTDAQPDYRDFEYFKTGADFGTIPSG